MTISQRGSATHSTTANGTQCIASKPSGVVAGDLLIATFLSNDQNATFPSGFVEFEDELTGLFRLQAARKIATGSEPSSYTVSVGSDAPLVLSISAWSGVDNTNPIYSSSVAVSNSAVNEAEPLTGPTTGTIPVARGRKLYLRACRSTTAIPTFSTAAGGVTEIDDIGVFSGGTARYGLGWYKDDSDLGYDARTTQAGIAITCSTTETNNISQTYVLTAAVAAPSNAATGAANAPSQQINPGHATATGVANQPLVFTGREASYGVKVDWTDVGFLDISDNFNRADSASLGTSSSGHTWVMGTGTCGVTSNQADSSGTAHAVIDAGIADVDISLTLATETGGGGIFFRQDTSDHGIFFVSQSGQYKLSTWDGATSTTIGGPVGSANHGDVLRVVCVGTSINCYVNGTLLITATSSFHQTDTSHGFEIKSGGRFDDFRLTNPGEDITARTLAAGRLSFQYGRDQARAIDAIRPAETAFRVNNETGEYSPDNSSSPLTDNLEPGKPILITGDLNGNTFNLFRGFLDNYKVVPSNKEANTVEFTGLDVLYKLREAVLSTPVYESLQSGEAINVLLDEIGWPEEDRDIDQGATTLRWWWEEGTNGLDALAKIVGSEGPAAFAYVDGEGKLVFRDRHHRYFRTASKEVQATFRASGTEPLFSEPMEYEAGWRDLINQVVIEVGEREPSLFTVVWSTETPIVLEPGESVTLDVKTDTPFYNAITPTFGVISTKDITFRSGSSVEVLLSRDSGQSLKIILTGDSSAVISKLQLRAQLLPVARTLKVIAEDSDSIAKHGVRTLQPSRAVWANAHDALAIASIIVSQRSKRLPVVHITVKNANASRMIEILSRDLSDRIHIVEPTNSIDDDFFIEQIKHTVSHAGKLHEAVFGCERAVANNDAELPNYFTFDKAGSGFDQGVFGEEGFLESSLVFVLDDSETGRLDVGGLGF